MKKFVLASMLLMSLFVFVGCSKTVDLGQVNFDANSVAPQYVLNSPASLEAAHGERPYVLFFHAKWCILCKTVEENVLADLESFPEETLILQADYDKDVDLKKQYGVNYQSSLVFVDREGQTQDIQIAPDNEQIKKSINLTK